MAGIEKSLVVKPVADVAYISAVSAGVISFLSPCVLPLVPPYFCYMTGVSVASLTGTDGNASTVSGGRGKIVLAAICFVLGFTTVFTGLGAGASAIGGLLRQYQDLLSTIAGILIIVMGLHFIGVFRIGLLFREARMQGGGAGYAGSYVMGLAFAFGWTPCIGPVLGTILSIAATREGVGEGASLLAAYSLGLGIPFVVAAMFVQPFMRFLNRFSRHLDKVEKLMGALLIVAGLAFLTGQMQAFSFWLLETFPALGKLG